MLKLLVLLLAVAVHGLHVDVLMHLSSETETTLRSVQNFFNHYNAIAVGHLRDTNEWQLSYMSMNHLSSASYQDVGIAKYNVGNMAEGTLNNYHMQYVQAYFELKQNEDYSAVHRLVGHLDGRMTKVQGKNGNWAYLTPMKRYSDGKKFYYIMMTQTFAGYTNNKNSYRAISELVQYIMQNFPGLYIFVGDFNVQGHEAIFKHLLGEENYHIAPFYKIATCNDNEGVAAPDGLVVSKELYPRIEYSVDPYPGYSYQHFIVTAKLYPKVDSESPAGMFSKLAPTFQQYLENVVARRGRRDNFVGNPGKFDPRDPTNVENIKVVPLTRLDGPIVSIA